MTDQHKLEDDMEYTDKDGRGLCCQGCRFGKEIFPLKMQCRRKAPVIGDFYNVDSMGLAVKTHVAEWPVVMAFDWCGEYELDPTK